MKLTDKIPALPKWILRTIGYGIAAMIIYVLIKGFALFRIARHTEDCSASSSSFATADHPPLKRAQSMAICIDRHNGFPENLFFQPVMQMLASLPNYPCKYVGVWTSTRPGSVYKVSMADDGKFTAEFVAGNAASDPVSGSWGSWQNNIVWFYDQGIVWPPDVNPVINAEADRFSLIEHNGSHTQFTRLEALESKVCGTSGVKIGGGSEAAKDVNETDSASLLPRSESAPPLKSWAGKFSIPAAATNAALSIDINADGQFSASFACAPANGGVLRTVTETGYLQNADEWYQVNAEAKNAVEACRLPSRFYPLQWAGQRYLLADSQLTALVNQINAGQAVTPEKFLQSDGNQIVAVWPASPYPSLPKPYGDGIKSAPLQGKLAAFGTIGAASPYALMQTDLEQREYRVKATLNLGSRHGIFNGMLLHADHGPNSLRIEVIETRLEQSSVRLDWQGRWQPMEGMQVSTRPANKR